VLPTTHPSAVLRARDAREAAYDGLVADLRVAVEALSGR
jgi:DNA polymerase